jgi:hypothetical protein
MIDSIGLPEPSPGSYVDYEESGWDCVFPVVNRARSVGPTRIEVIGPKRFSGTPAESRGQSIADVQGNKPCKTHGIVVATQELDRLHEHVQRLGVRHWLEIPVHDKTPFPRLWTGVTADEPCRYLPDDDAGLMFEFIPSDSAAFTPKLFQTPAPEPVDPTPGQMIRVLSRAFIVDDIDGALQTLSKNFLWEPEGSVIEDRSAGYRSVVMSRNFVQGAALKLVEPLDAENPVGEYAAKWGSGPFTIRVAVHNLEAKCDDLSLRGTPFVERAPTDYEPARLLIDPAATASMPFEFVEFGSAVA